MFRTTVLKSAQANLNAPKVEVSRERHESTITAFRRGFKRLCPIPKAALIILLLDSVRRNGGLTEKCMNRSVLPVFLDREVTKLVLLCSVSGWAFYTARIFSCQHACRGSESSVAYISRRPGGSDTWVCSTELQPGATFLLYTLVNPCPLHASIYPIAKITLKNECPG
jgi:hypothetical protein